MRCLKKFALLVFAAAAIPILFCAGCRENASYDDPYYHDRHQWSDEKPYYDRWERETHRQHEDFNKRSQQDQKDYWDWRHHH